VSGGELVISAPLPVLAIRERSQHVQALIKDLMIEEVHYMTIPGTSGKALTKQGSEMLLASFQIAVEPEIEDKSDADAVRYTVRITGRHMGSGIIVGVGVGRCSSNEEKYKWQEAVCREEFDATPETRRRIKWYHKKGGNGVYSVYQVRTNPEDKANTVLKMAKKRAQVDLCLTALAASDAFKRQPRPPDPRGTPVSSKDKSSQQGLGDDARAPAATPSAGGVSAPGGRGPVAGSPSSPRPATQAQLGLIRQKLDRAGIAENYFFAQFEIGRFEDLAFERVNQALAWIDELDKGPS
jgi:hypothetical protein